MALILNFGTASLIACLLLLPSETQAFRKYGGGSSEAVEPSNLSSPSPLTSRIRKLPPRYSQHYFSPFQPVQADTKTYVSMPTNPANFFGPQSYWAQVANRLIDNVVGTVGGAYAKTKGGSSAERLEAFRKALQKENATKLHQQPLAEFKQKELKTNSAEIHEVGMDVSQPSEATWQNQRIQYTDRNGKLVASAEVVQPVRPSTPAAPRAPKLLSAPFEPKSEFGILPTLLLKNPNARTKFYHLEKYANPQYPAGLKQRKVYEPLLAASSEYTRDSAFYRRPGSSELRRKPARVSSAGYYGDDSPEQGSQEIKFRSALKKILADFRRHHPTSRFRALNRSRELSYLAQKQGAQSTRRRRPQSRRIVHLPARYGSSEDFLRWRH